MMNCLEFRRWALADPVHPGPEALEHEAACPDCAHFYLALRQQEEALYQALTVPVPEGLADRILLKRRPRRFSDFRDIRLWAPALAATLVLVLGLSLLLPPRGISPESLAAGVIAHVRHEPETLVAEQGVTLVKLAHAFARSGGDLLALPAEVSYAGRCPLPGGGHGEHIVMKTPQGKVTLILMPGKPLAAALRLFKDGLNVSVLPAGEGSLALVAETDAQVREAEAAIQRTVRWRGRAT